MTLQITFNQPLAAADVDLNNLDAIKNILRLMEI